MSLAQNAVKQTIRWQEITVREKSVSGNNKIVNNEVWYLPAMLCRLERPQMLSQTPSKW
jgi:hypothetical protein